MDPISFEGFQNISFKILIAPVTRVHVVLKLLQVQTISFVLSFPFLFRRQALKVLSAGQNKTYTFPFTDRALETF